jgi:hypothetical protein
MKALIAAIALATMLAGLTAARAGDYPSRPITIIVPFAAGGPSDVMARILTPVQGFCAETGGAITVFAATWLGIPVSTTHTITGSIVGVGAARKVSAVRWNVASNIVIAWVVTLPAAGLMAALSYSLCGLAP